ncbi:MAG: hypothetical protein LBE16_01760 [Clostridiales Family XIII bacterium]|jgi:hypothetical protein|nr:hypothetical protein [Clostridiales Family XIII bacterium]
MADFGALTGISSLYNYSSQVGSLYNLKNSNSSLFDALNKAAAESGATSVFDTVNSILDSLNGDASQSASVDSDALQYLQAIKSGAKELDAALGAAPQAASAGGEEAEEAVKNVVDGTNKLLSAVYENIGEGSERLFDDIVGAVTTYVSALNRVGVTMGSDGLLQIDEEKLKSASESGEINKFFTQTSSANYGFTSKLAKVVSNIKQNPSYYTNASASAVNNTGYYDSQSYSAYSNVGLLLDFPV